MDTEQVFHAQGLGAAPELDCLLHGVDVAKHLGCPIVALATLRACVCRPRQPLVADLDPFDPGRGRALGAQQIARQNEGSFAYGLGASYYSENTIKDGRVVEGNFDTYEVARMEDIPKIESHVMASGGFWGGVGEPTIAVCTPAVLNAYFAATGKRIRSLPLSQHGIV